MMTIATSEFRSRRPLILTVPGLGGSGPGHWQTIWEQERDDCVRADLGQWSAPRRNAWVSKLDQAIRRCDMPVILAAHSLGCIAVAWWAELAGQPWGWPVAGALLVAPPDVERADRPAALAHFAPGPRAPLPFPSILVTSEDDPYASLQRGFDMARDWGSHFVDIGAAGHINADSCLGAWREGQLLVERLIGAAEGPMASGGTMADVQPALAGESAALPIR